MSDMYLRVTMPDGSQWDVPVATIARNRAAAYADEFDGNLARSLMEDTMPLFESDPSEIRDWAEGNMNWSDVSADAIRVIDGAEPDWQKGWVCGPKEIVRK